jgi:hypothetical protein
VDRFHYNRTFKIKRIAMAVNALSKKWGYPEMIRNSKKDL